jgi:hypothetical protein
MRPPRIIITQGTAAGRGRLGFEVVFFLFPAGLNLAIKGMVTPGRRTMGEEMLNRRLLLSTLVLPGCFTRTPEAELVPIKLGDWRRVAVENFPNEQVREEIRRMGFKRARRAFYENAGNRIGVMVYEMNAQAVAFELVQKWRPEPQKMAFHQGPFFVVLDSDKPNQGGLAELSALIEQELKK